MPIRGTALAATVWLALGSPACKSGSGAETAIAPTGDTPVSGAAAADATDIPQVAEAPPWKLRASIEGLDDILAAVTEIARRLSPDSPWDARANLQALLLTTGFGPGLLESLDLAGLHALAVVVPSKPNAGPRDLAATIAVTDTELLIASVPAAWRPSAIGDGTWQIRNPEGGPDLLLRRAQGAMHVGFDEDDLAAASRLPALVGTGPRIRVRVWDFPPDSAPAVPGELGNRLDRVREGLEAIEVGADLGADRDVRLLVSADGPFDELGVEALGPSRAAPTALEQRLPGDAAVVITTSAGDVGPLHRELDKIDLRGLPDPFSSLASRALAHVHALADQGKDDVALILYLSSRGKATVVIAGGVRDDAAARKAMQGLAEVARDALEEQRKLAGPSAGLSASWKPATVAVGSARADQLTIVVPKDLRSELRSAAAFLSRDRLEMLQVVTGGIGVFAIGGDAKAVVASLAKPPRKASLATDTGLERVRELMGGCQVCAAADPVALLRLRLLMLRDSAEDAIDVRAVKRSLSALAKIRVDAGTAAGLTIEADHGKMGAVVAKNLVFAPAKTVEQLIDAVELVGRDGKPAEPGP